ncbi:MAG TPA: MgtC/SapB family protein, partial [Isosphaeraceae bacterium]|nr:MgtC/SapB family protein [Isosphaeraceae bacterium]
GVVMGMGFVGAGSILRTGLNVHGITTAACLWLVSAVGLAAGGGMYFEAVFATGAGLFVLIGLNAFELQWKQKAKRQVTVDLDENLLSRSSLIAAVNTGGVAVISIGYDRDLEAHSSCLELVVSLAAESATEPLLARLEVLPGVRRVRIRVPDAAG